MSRRPAIMMQGGPCGGGDGYEPYTGSEHTCAHEIGGGVREGGWTAQRPCPTAAKTHCPQQCLLDRHREEEGNEQKGGRRVEIIEMIGRDVLRTYPHLLSY